MIHFIYEVTNQINGKKYIGRHQSRGLPHNTKYRGRGIAVLAAHKKYGIENFSIKVLEVCVGRIHSEIVEGRYLVRNNVVKDENYYNLTENTGGGYNHAAYTKESRAKIGKANSRRVWSEESKHKLGRSNKDVWPRLHKQITCIHCNFTCNAGNHSKWHGDNCKHKRLESNDSNLT